MQLHYSPYDFEVDMDPYPYYAQLRETAPVYRNEADDFWALSRHADVVAALRDSTTYSSANGMRMESAFWGPQAAQFFSFVAMDAPEHTRMRGLVAKAFTKQRVQALQPRVREIARNLVEPLLERETFDLMGDFAGPYPTEMISELVGVPEADREMVRKLGMEIMHTDEEATDLSPEATQAIGALVGYYTELTLERARHRRDDLLSALLDAADGEDRLRPEEIVGVLILLVGAGIETTMLTLGNLWYAAWLFPDQRRQAVDRVEDWTAEGMRYAPTTHTLLRTTTAEVSLHGVTIPPDARILLLSGSANRDPEAFANPDTFDLDRDITPSMVFGAGRHRCLGSHLGLLEIRTALEELTGSITDYDIDTDRLRRIHSSNARGFAYLPTTVITR